MLMSRSRSEADRRRVMLPTGVWRQIFHMMLGIALCTPSVYPQGCASKSCLQCTSTPANCTVDNTTQTVNCTGNTSSCTISPCDGTYTYCLATYYGNRTSSLYYFTSGCIGITGGFDCPSNPQTCIGSGNVDSEEVLFSSYAHDVVKLVVCTCYADNCTSNISFHYDIVTPLVSSIQPEPSLLPNEPDTKKSRSELYFVVPAVIIFTCIVVALLVGVVLFVRHHRRKTHSSSSRGPQTSAFSHMVPTDPLLPSLTPSSPTCPSSSSPNVKLIKLIGRGRFGAVWKAELAGNGTMVAAKVFTYHSRHSWENESRLYSMQSTSHPNILQYLGSHTTGEGGHDAQMYVFAPYYELGSLAHFLREAPPLTWAQMCTVLRCVVGGVAHLHSECYTNAAGLVVQKYAIAHRDVKSANVLMRSAEGDCVVGDLGLALVLDPTMDPKQMANSGQVGTFRYMAPEALDARVNLQDLESFKQIDVYALALVMWEVAWRCGSVSHTDGVVPPYQLPFQELAGDHPTLDQMKDIVVTAKQRPPIPPSWRNHEGMTAITTAIQDSWDDDSEARLTAAGIMCRLDTVKDCAMPIAVDNVSSVPVASAPTASTAAITTTENHVISAHAHVDHAMPPPYSAEDPHPAAILPARRTRFHFLSSLPVLRPSENARSLNARNRNICNSVVLEGETSRYQPAAVRYSLILAADRSSLLPRASDALTTSVSVELVTLQANLEDDGNQPLVRANSQTPISALAGLSLLQRTAAVATARMGAAQAPALSPNLEVSERSGDNTLDVEPHHLQSVCV